ncbi:hypothetical protein BJ875DRAFT_466232 [Amylocarpus encephaloides]|uniref:protein disulfide-isomerase n=1 Tax=Amylocarpus encephaloides TaxID=45428 RepID=A0A9P8C3K3_9HELO|nr:hypothetical protein BJ875DRAFT_466232 [Amylocarpus encephaloides]
MVQSTAIAVAAAALLGALPVNAGLYSKGSPVLQLDGKSYDRLIAQSNYTSIVEFYAPWCGHCKNLQPAYEKAAKSLAGLAKVGAVDCDEETNKPFCGTFGVQGFPTLKIIKPGKKPGKPIVEDYNGPRTAKGIVDAVVEKIPNLVKKVEDKTLEKFLAESNDTAKAILFTDKGKTSALMKSIAIEFKGAISVAQCRNTEKEKATMELFGITGFPTLLLLPGGKEAQGIVYDGELKKDPIIKFLSQAAAPNPDPAPSKAKVSKKDSKKESKAKEEFESSSSSQASKEGSTAGATATEEVLEGEATESPIPIVETEKPVDLPEPPPMIPALETEEELIATCLGDRTATCILALLPESPDITGAQAIISLSELAHKYNQRKQNLFPFYIVMSQNKGYDRIKEALKLTGNSQIIAVNGRRGWWRQISETLSNKDVSIEALENFVDAIRLGEGAKQKLPAGLIPKEPEEAATATEEEPAAATETMVVEEDREEATQAETHDEL